ncbi:MAG: thioredoxin domain-containing protein [Sphingomonadales bacterium]|nr:thioredoxin domain-containing protein [Sphingomonadales bacterium]NCQ20269.1 thioredoxin domain-containing protein [Sphingomonadales bacterium]NCT02872.1 thioredoxin domain-containing protein [Sphingomonadales bacterium]
MIKPLLLAAVASAAAAATLATVPALAQQDLSRPDSAFEARGKPGNWQSMIVRTERGHLIGNPEADTRLIEFISYTCPHCSDFTAQGEPALELALLTPGKMALEVRPVIRNALDLTVTLLAQCGDPSGFKSRHQTLMRTQSDWLGKARAAPESQRAIWLRGDKAGRMNAASALGLTMMLVERGQSQSELDACVVNDVAAKALVDNSRADFDEVGVQGTPSFALDGKLLNAVHSWETLYPVLSARFTTAPSEGLGAPG